MHMCKPVSLLNACCAKPSINSSPCLHNKARFVLQGKCCLEQGLGRCKPPLYRWEIITIRSPQKEGPAFSNQKLEKKDPDRNLESVCRNPLQNPAEILSLLKAKQNDKGLTSLKGTRAKSGKKQLSRKVTANRQLLGEPGKWRRCNCLGQHS